jgi:hypothetical protein
MLIKFLFTPFAVFALAVVASLLILAAVVGNLRDPSRINGSQCQGGSDITGSGAQQDQPRINITRSQYEQALATWHAQKVEEYEITTQLRSFLGGAVALHVGDYGGRIDQLAPEAQAFSKMTDEDARYLKRYSIEGLFASVDAILDGNEVFRPTALTGTGATGTESFHIIYHVTFDPNLGYPRCLAASPISESGVIWSDTDWALDVTWLKIIKQAK